MAVATSATAPPTAPRPRVRPSTFARTETPWRALRPHAQAAMPTVTRASSRSAAALRPSSPPNTHTSHTAVASSGKARPCFNVSIHGPGRGRRAIHEGRNDSST